MIITCLPPTVISTILNQTCTPPVSPFNEDDFDEDDPEPSQIREYLHLGSYSHALGYCARTLEWKQVRNKAAMLERERRKRLGKYKYILNAARECDCVFRASKKVEYLHLEDLDDDVGADIQSHFEKCFAFIDKARREGQIVLVHCFQGVSRSATIVVAYLMRSENMTREEAIAEVKARRPMIKPNPAFFQALGRFEEELARSRRPPVVEE